MALALFDIDGTLVRRAGPHHRRALVEAVREVAGLETTTDGIPVQGMLDPDILKVMMRAAGAPERAIRRNLPAIVRHAERVYLRTCPDLTRKTCPGVRGLLGTLAGRGVVLGLVTGNLTRIGWKKLACAGLKPFFRYGAFGEMARDRAGLVRLAVREAHARGWVERSAPVALIGDAPADILAARANRAVSIAVRTGISLEEELRACGPDFLLDDLRALRPSMITGGYRGKLRFTPYS
jgi:phosphoglycolate phosphatase